MERGRQAPPTLDLAPSIFPGGREALGVQFTAYLIGQTPIFLRASTYVAKLTVELQAVFRPFFDAVFGSGH
ncbi:MAG TPA: hypothetical protein DIW53_18915 [Achromobacter sp.]|nr:hypothetical protein [Achromobacter sp.]